MALDNPAFSRNSAFSQQGAVAAAQDVSAQQLQEMYNQPATLPDREVMTVENTVAKTAGAFAVLLVVRRGRLAAHPDDAVGRSGSPRSSASCSRSSTSSRRSRRPR